MKSFLRLTFLMWLSFIAFAANAQHSIEQAGPAEAAVATPSVSVVPTAAPVVQPVQAAPAQPVQQIQPVQAIQPIYVLPDGRQLQLVPGSVPTSPMPPQVASPQLPPTAPPAELKTTLRKRQHNLSWEYSTVKVESTRKINGVTTFSDSSLGKFNLTYGYEFGFVQPMVSMSSQIETAGIVESKIGTFALGGRISFIENRPGNDLIPFVGLLVYGISITETDSTGTFDADGNAAEFGFGLDWYPLGEIMAIRLMLGGYDRGLEYEVGPSKGTLNSTGSALSIGYVYSF